MKALDIGCGPGINTSWLSGQHDVVGIDISFRALKTAPETLRGKLVCGDIESMPFRSSTFNLVFCGAVLHHFPSMRRVVGEIHRVLKNRGLVFSYDPNAYHFYNFIGVNIINRITPQKQFSPNERALFPGELRREFHRQRFVNIAFDSLNMTSRSRKRYAAVRALSTRISNMILKDPYRGSMLVMYCEKQDS